MQAIERESKSVQFEHAGLFPSKSDQAPHIIARIREEGATKTRGMGSIYRLKGRKVWWIKFYCGHKCYRE